MGFDFDYIIRRPGLSFVLVDIILNVDIETVAKLDEVSDSWRQFFIDNRVLEKKIKFAGDLECLYEKFFGTEKDETEDHVRRKKFLLGISKEGIKSEWENSETDVKQVIHNDVRDVKVLGHNRLFYTSGRGVQLTERRPLTMQPCINGSSMEKRPTGIKEFVGHRLEICTLDFCQDLCVTAGKDRSISFWNFKSGKMASKYVDAHDRLITMVRIYPVARKEETFITISSSRDWTVKLWMVDSISYCGTVNVVLKQKLLGYPKKSMWGLDFSWPYIVGACANGRMLVWKAKIMLEDLSGTRRKFYGPTAFDLHADFVDDGQESLRAVALIDQDPNFAVSGDLLGRLNVWNVGDKCHQYLVPEDDTKSFFNTWNSVTAIVQKNGLAFVAYSSKQYVRIFSTERVKDEFIPIRHIYMGDELIKKRGRIAGVPSPTIRSVDVCDTGTEIYVCAHSGLFVISVWKN